jgi:hypothetical protein
MQWGRRAELIDQRWLRLGHEIGEQLRILLGLRADSVRHTERTLISGGVATVVGLASSYKDGGPLKDAKGNVVDARYENLRISALSRLLCDGRIKDELCRTKLSSSSERF